MLLGGGNMSKMTKAYLFFYIILIIVLFILSLPIILPSHGFILDEGEIAYLETVGTLRAVGDNGFPPFSFSVGDTPVGYEADLVMELQRILGVTISIEQHPWTEVRNMLESGAADFITGMRITPERTASYVFTQPYLVSSHALIVPHGNAANTLEDLRGSRIVAQDGSSTYERLVSEGFEAISVPHPGEAYIMLTAGLADAWVEHEWVARYYIGSQETYQWHIRSLAGTRGDYALAVSRAADPRLSTILSKALLKLRYEGALTELDTRWFGPALQEVTDARRQQVRIVAMVFFVASIGLGLVLNNSYLQHQVRLQTQKLSLANSELSKQQEKLQEMLLNAARAFGHAIEVKDIYTGGHSQRVAKVTYAIATEMHLDENLCYTLCLGALMHDIGKVGVPDHILAKTDRLSTEEMAAIRLHPEIGENILRSVDGYDHVRQIVLYHHERWDGKREGAFAAYPGLLQGNDIPLGARIVAVADAFDAMTSDRPYRRARSLDEALSVLQECSGEQFDPCVVAAAVRALTKINDMSELPVNDLLWSLIGKQIEL